MEIPRLFEERVEARRTGMERLIFPAPNCYDYRWQDSRWRWLRSIHLDCKDRIISCGLPKFMALDHGSPAFRIRLPDLLAAAKRDLVATSKIDGTCLIRYVQDGRVRFRTKQSFSVQLENKFEIDDFCVTYPELANPLFCAHETLIFEWVSPFNQIVVKYPEPALTLLASIVYDRDVAWHEANLHLRTFKELESIAAQCKIPLIDRTPLRSSTSVQDFLAKVQDLDKLEGYVLRFRDEQELVKVKSRWFLLMFSAKIEFSTPVAVELWCYWGKPDFSMFRDLFIATWNEQSWITVQPVVSATYDGIKQARNIISHVSKFFEENAALTSVEFDQVAAETFQQLRLEMVMTLRRREEIPVDVWKKLILQNCKQMSIVFEELAR